MKNRIKSMLIYLVPILSAYYIIPMIITDTGSAMLVLLIIIPCSVTVASLFFGFKNGFNIFFPILVGLLFLPSIFIHYNSSALVYSPEFGFMSLLASFIGSRFHKR